MSHGLSKLIGPVVLGLLTWTGHASAQDKTDNSKSSTAIIKTFVGVTRSGKPIEALITNDDLDLKTKKFRLCIVAGTDGAAHPSTVCAEIMKRFYDRPEFETLRSQLALSVVPDATPDETSGTTNGQRKQLQFPPTGDAYLDANNVEAQYLWRWLGMHAPDAVVELVEGPTNEFVDMASRPKERLTAHTTNTAIAGVGAIDGYCWQVPEGIEAPFADIAKMLTSEIAASPQKNIFKTTDQADALSKAHRELIHRVSRSPLEIAKQLSKTYGRDLPSSAYIPAVACLGRLRIAVREGDQATIDELDKIGAPYLSGAKQSLPEKSSGSDIAGHILWAELYDATKNPAYRDLVIRAANQAFTEDGQPREAMPTHNEMSDAVFMGCPVLAVAGRLTGDAKYFDMSLRHMRFMLKLNLRKDGLHQHSPLHETAWGRGNGFPALGLALALENIPPAHPGREEMLKAFQDHLTALIKHQDPTGAWHQVIDHPESYRELTSTCMITYAMVRGVRRGWLDAKQFAPAIEKGWEAVKVRVADSGELVDVCTGTGKMKSLRDYYDRTAILGKDARGGAMSLLICSEMAAWEAEAKK